MSCGTDLCPDEVPCFNITDFDSNDTIPDGAVVIVTIEGARDASSIGINKTEKLLFSNNSTAESNFHKIIIWCLF